MDVPVLLSATVHQCGGRVDVALVGELCASTAEQLAAILDAVVQDGAQDIHVHLRHLRLCTSDGVEVLEAARRSVASRAGTLALDGASGVVARVLQLLGMPLDDPRAERSKCLPARAASGAGDGAVG